MLYLKDTQNWKQFTTPLHQPRSLIVLCYISKILKIESNSQLNHFRKFFIWCCVISQRYSKLKAIHNTKNATCSPRLVVLYLKDTQNWKQFTTIEPPACLNNSLCYISKILKIESNSQHLNIWEFLLPGCVISQRYSKLKAIHNRLSGQTRQSLVVLYLKDTQNWKQFTTEINITTHSDKLCYISKILKIESNSQHLPTSTLPIKCCVISQRYSKLKAIHNTNVRNQIICSVVLYLKDTQNWKQFTTIKSSGLKSVLLCYISKILKIESNSQQICTLFINTKGCVISQRYSKLKAIHNSIEPQVGAISVVLYLKDTQNWKQFTTVRVEIWEKVVLCYISKILKIESNSQRNLLNIVHRQSCVISQRYSKLKAIHNGGDRFMGRRKVVLYLKDTQNWKQFTTPPNHGTISVKLCYISKILKIESNSQQERNEGVPPKSCVISQRYSKLKAIHNKKAKGEVLTEVVLYLKDTQNWKQFTTIPSIEQTK